MPGGFTTSQITSLRHQSRDLHNAMRKKFGVSRMLMIDGNLNQTAQKWAEYMASRNVLMHSYSGHPYYYGQHSKRFGSAGENVSAGWNSITLAVNKGWRESCPHFYNIINGNHRYMGTGLAKRGSTWFVTVHFSGSAGSCPSGTGGSNGFCCRCTGAGCKEWKNTDPRRP